MHEGRGEFNCEERARSTVPQSSLLRADLPMRPRALNQIDSAKNPLKDWDMMPLLRRGLGWLVLAVALDYGTSIAMVAAFGPSAEGNSVTREFYATGTLQSFVNLLVSQAEWITLTFFVAIAMLFARWGSTKKKPLVSISVWGISLLGIIVGWLFGMVRLAIGPPSNLSAFFTVAYGQAVGQVSYATMAIIAVVLVSFDFILTLHHHRRSSAAAGQQEAGLHKSHPSPDRTGARRRHRVPGKERHPGEEAGKP